MDTLYSETARILDEVGERILHELQCDARLSMSELSRRVGLSAPAVAERVRRLEDAGIISAYRAEVNPHTIGLEMQAFVRIQLYANHETKISDLAKASVEVLEAHNITGDDCMIMKVAFVSISHLERFLETLRPHGRLTTSIILSSPVPANSRPIAPAGTATAVDKLPYTSR